MYHAAQNVVLGFGAMCGASFGGVVADSIGWRWCYLCQVPISATGLIVGYFVIKNPPPPKVTDGPGESRQMSSWRQIDCAGASLLVLCLSALLTALSLGGNKYPWSNLRVILSFVVSVLVLFVFVGVELRTSALPVMPMWMLRGRTVVSNMVSNVLVGMSAFSFLFTIPLFFQAVLSESASKAGLRLIIPSLATPLGSFAAGYVMSRWGVLNHLVRLGCFLMLLGNALMASLDYHDSKRKYLVYLFPANLGQGIVFPSILFTNISTFEHSCRLLIPHTIRSDQEKENITQNGAT